MKMKQKKLAAGGLAVLAIVAAWATAVTVWQQVNSSGFGDPLAHEVSAVAAFNGYLYAGTSNATNSARIFRSADGTVWNPVIDPGFGSAHDTAPPAILDLMVFNGRLYASTGRGNAAQIWRTLDGTNWARVVNAGFGDPDVVDITMLAAYNGLIYAGATNAVSGAQIWRSFTGDSNSWTQVAPAVAGTAVSTITGFAVFDGALYAAVQFENPSPVQIWRSFGGDWTAVVTDGFGDSNTTLTGGMAEFGGYLYAGAGNTVDGAQLWRSNDGENWEQVITPGFGDANNQIIEAVYAFQNHLYVSTKNTQTGIEMWRTADGSVWEQVNQDGFDGNHNTGSNQANAVTHFLNQLYVGTINTIDGGELWRQNQPFGVTLSADDFLVGVSGQSVTHTVWITNTGTTADTFNLAVSGNSWGAALSTEEIALHPSSSSNFTVVIAIPVFAGNSDIDTVTVTATSQGNPIVHDSAILTTGCTGQKIYLPAILLSP